LSFLLSSEKVTVADRTPLAKAGLIQVFETNITHRSRPFQHI
jgi:hypothetical protein